MTFEESLRRLETIAAELDRHDLTLEQAMALFEEGVARLQEAHAALQRAEGRVTQLVEREDGRFEETGDGAR